MKLTMFLKLLLKLMPLIFISILVVSCNKPTAEEARKNSFLPPLGFKKSAIKGDELFHNKCAACHGNMGTGSDKGPPLVHKIYEPGHHADLSFYRAAKGGVKHHHWQFGDMPPVNDITPEDVAHIIAYVRKQQRVAGIR